MRDFLYYIIFLYSRILIRYSAGIYSFAGSLLGKVVILGEHFSVTNVSIYSKKVVLERKVLGSKTVAVLVADLSAMFDIIKGGGGEDVIVEPVEVFKWEKTENTKGDLFLSESNIVQYSESDGIIVHSFWH